MYFDARGTLSKKERHMLNLMAFNEHIWENRISRSRIDRWLDNFLSEEDKLVALDILSKFLYFNENEIMKLCEIAFKQLLLRISKIEAEKVSIDLKNLREKFLKRCRFYGLGGASESSHHLLYRFRQMNDLPEALFPKNIDVDFTGDFIVFFDDMIGTGEQACKYWERNIENKFDSRIKKRFFYLVLAAYTDGIEEIERQTKFEVIPCIIFDNSYRAFNEKSCFFIDKKERKKARNIAEKYGKNIHDWPLGFLNFQGLMGFHHNIPDTTLPIIWKRNGWFPIFVRYARK